MTIKLVSNTIDGKFEGFRPSIDIEKNGDATLAISVFGIGFLLIPMKDLAALNFDKIQEISPRLRLKARVDLCTLLRGWADQLEANKGDAGQ